jgi:hypothetical protein
MKKMKKYSGQAIAIIMVVLVVATVIGASLYSRVTRNRQMSIETTESKRALEQADSVLDVFISSEILDIQQAFKGCIASDDGCELNGVLGADDLDKVEGFLSGQDVDTTVLQATSDWCDEEPSGDARVVISYATLEDFVEYDVGEVKAINFEGVTIPEGCKVTFAFEQVDGGDDAVFTTKEVYTDGFTGYKDYEEDDMKLYCVDGNENGCDSGSVAPASSVVEILLNEESIDFNVAEMENIYEIRILPLRHKLNISMQPSEQCGDLFSDFKIMAEVMCSNTVGTKETIVPNARSMGYPTLFDYTIFNAEGTLEPSYD